MTRSFSQRHPSHEPGSSMYEEDCLYWALWLLPPSTPFRRSKDSSAAPIGDLYLYSVHLCVGAVRYVQCQAECFWSGLCFPMNYVRHVTFAHLISGWNDFFCIEFENTLGTGLWIEREAECSTIFFTRCLPYSPPYSLDGATRCRHYCQLVLLFSQSGCSNTHCTIVKWFKSHQWSAVLWPNGQAIESLVEVPKRPWVRIWQKTTLVVVNLVGQSHGLSDLVEIRTPYSAQLVKTSVMNSDPS